MIWLLACGSERGPQSLPEGDITYEGYILTSPEEDAGVFSSGTASFVLGSEPELELREAEQPFPDQYPGYWGIEVPPDTPFQLTLQGDGYYPAIWAGMTPSTPGSWFSGALFAAETDYIDSLAQTLAPEAPPLSEGGVQLWGVPLDPEAWDCAKISIQDATGTKSVSCFTLSEDGATLTPITTGSLNWFYAAGLEPGEILLDSGIGGSYTYSAIDGSIVMAIWFVGGGT